LRAGSRRTRLESWLETGLRTRFCGRILPVDKDAADRWGRPLPVIGGLLAATALHHNLTFVTRNVSQVEAGGVLVLDPWG